MFLSRESANISNIKNGKATEQTMDYYGDEGYVFRNLPIYTKL